jgi:hypothetical protein
MTSTQLFILAFLEFLFTVGIPAALALFYTAQAKKEEGKLTIMQKAKLVYEQNKELVDQCILAAEAIFKAGQGPAKFKYVLNLISDKMNLPSAELTNIIEAGLAKLKLQWGEAWNSLSEGVPTIPNQPDIPIELSVEPTETIIYPSPGSPLNP